MNNVVIFLSVDKEHVGPGTDFGVSRLSCWNLSPSVGYPCFGHVVLGFPRGLVPCLCSLLVHGASKVVLFS